MAADGAARPVPDYPITSVDHALRLVLLLQREGALGVRDAAVALGVSPSKAHRLLAMLVYRGFADQGPDRRYHPGPVLHRTPHAAASVVTLRQLARRHLEALVDEVDETVNLTILSGTAVHFILTVQADRALRSGDRTGASLPAHRTSGGKVLLATLAEEELAAVYAGVAGVELEALLVELEQVRRRGYAINDQQTETGLSAVGVLVPAPAGVAPAAVSIASPTGRFERGRIPSWVRALRVTADRIADELTRAHRSG
ncbi:IclR family transcriptional regulator [Nitriliruptor alkaliphilus]|uniref:IclR family transcriptional regulator n=1 Tax=Nitriliruptor alkaliphilus TaxID=427918 RepID=UPI000695D01E|nr:IclR family transcriptional regulator C-terminal domain-containing protein [Nitriliruptor alkaliphilus]